MYLSSYTISLLVCCTLLLAHVNAANLITNPSFESGSTGWQTYGITTAAQDGTSSAYCTATTQTVTKGAYQVVSLNQATASPILIQGWAKAAAAVTGSGSYSLYADINLMDGTWVYGQQAIFSSTSTAWQLKSITTSTGPIKDVWVYFLFRNMQGSVWFDNIYVGPASGAPTVAPTTTATATTTTATATTTTTGTTAKATTTTTGATTSTTKAGTTSTTTGGTTTTAKATTATTGSATTTGAAATTGSTTTTGAASLTTGSYTLGLKYMILAPAVDDIRLGSAKLAFDAIGSQYDVVVPSEVNGNFSLTDSTGNNGKYLGFVYAIDFLTLTAAQQAQLNAYQTKFNTKAVIMYTFPYPANGVQTASVGASAKVGSLTFASAATGFTSGYSPNAVITNDGVYTYPADIVDATIAQPAMYISYPPSTTQYVAAAFVTVNGNRQLQFFLDQATWCIHSTALGMFWIQWMSNNMYLGLRRIFLNAQVDDLFMDSDEFDVVAQAETETLSYRITPTELQNFANFQVTTNAKLPAGSNITIAFPFNGATVEEYGGITKDALYIKTKALLNSFTFMSHTYDHPELDALTYAQVKKEMTDNFKITLELFGAYTHPRYSNASMVTPSISGLFNGNALQALYDVGIRHIVGDNSRPELRTPFAYHGWYTTVATNGFAGMYVVPREATDIYYDCTLPAETVSEYNKFYQATLGTSTFDQIIAREVSRTNLNLLAFRYDPYMFHQANMRGFTYNGESTSLLAYWIENVVKGITQYYSLPILSHSQDMMSQKWLDRESRDACGFTGKVQITNKQIVGITASTTAAYVSTYYIAPNLARVLTRHSRNNTTRIRNLLSFSCRMAITGINVPTSTTVSTETYGPDKTTWISTKANTPFTLTFTTPITL